MELYLRGMGREKFSFWDETLCLIKLFFFFPVEILGVMWIPAKQQTMSQLLLCHDELSAVHSCCLHRLLQTADERGLCRALSRV